MTDFKDAWQRTNDKEPTPDLPKALLYDPISGDGDFQYLSLEDRLIRLAEFHRSEGFAEGFRVGREPPGEIEQKLEEAWGKGND